MPGYDKNIDDPFDVHVFRKLAKFLVDPLHNVGLTPSNVTTISVFFAFFSLMTYTLSFNILSVVLFLIYYVLDCADGQIARKFNKTSFDGAVYDWNKDHIVGLSFVLFFLVKDPLAALSCIGMIFPMLLHISTLDKVAIILGHNKEGSNSEKYTILWYRYYSFSKKVCKMTFDFIFNGKSNDKILSSAEIIKFYGTGIYTLMICLSILGFANISIVLTTMILSSILYIKVRN